jgi:hypothetical protein
VGRPLNAASVAFRGSGALCLPSPPSRPILRVPSRLGTSAQRAVSVARIASLVRPLCFSSAGRVILFLRGMFPDDGLLVAV